MQLILLMGAPGSGKGTQGKRLANSSNAQFQHISAGDVVREVLHSPDHPLTKKYQTQISSGQLLPDEVMLDILRSHIQDLEYQNKEKAQNPIFLLDGYPRNEKQYQDVMAHLAKPIGVIHIDCPIAVLKQRLSHRTEGRSDDNETAIDRRLKDYERLTSPLINSLKRTTTVLSIDGQALPEDVEALIQLHLPKLTEKTLTLPWYEAPYHLVKVSGRITDFTRQMVETLGSLNFMIQPPLMPPICFLQSRLAVQAVLRSHGDLGDVYRQFSRAAGLKYDFTSLNSQNKPNQPNIWRLAHDGFSQSMKQIEPEIERLIAKHLPRLFPAPTFELDQTFDNFFAHLWCDFLFGLSDRGHEYQRLKNDIISFMRQCFYTNQLKALDVTGLSSWMYSMPQQRGLVDIKARIKTLLSDSKSGVMSRFRQKITEKNASDKLGLSDEILEQITLDNVFDLIFIPDFLQGALYETVVKCLQKQISFDQDERVKHAYQFGLNQSYLFPYRSRVLTEEVELGDGTHLPKGATVVINLKEVGLYHSSGPRRCLGIGFTEAFKKHFFDLLKMVDLQVDRVSYPESRAQLVGDENVPLSPARYHVSWYLKSGALQQQLSWHRYKGLRFYDVLQAYEKAPLRHLIVAKMTQQIESYCQNEAINLAHLVIVGPEMRGVPLAAILADKLGVPFVTIRKSGGYKMPSNLVETQTYQKGYGQEDALELPHSKRETLEGKQVIILDDGIASGQSMLACCELVKKLGGAPVLIQSIIEHTYTQTDPVLRRDYKVNTLFMLSPENGTVAVNHQKAKISEPRP